MTFAGTAPVHKSLPAWRRLAQGGIAVTAMAALLSACGGGDQVKRFQATKILSFGDENSALVEGNVGSLGTIKGLKYGVNTVTLFTGYDSDLDLLSPVGLPSDGVLTTTQAGWASYPTSGEDASGLALNAFQSASLVQRVFTLPTTYTQPSVTGTQSGNFTVTYQYLYSCSDNPLWLQILARSYGLGYKDQCPAETASGAVTYAAGGATVSDTVAQVAAHRGEFTSSTLVTIMAGQNDILAAYAQVKAGTMTPNVAQNAVAAQGAALAALVNDIYNSGTRVMIVKLPNLGLSPLARADGREALLEDLTLAFNTAILSNIKNNGRGIALVDFYDESYRFNKNPTAYGYNDFSSSVCGDTTYQPDGTAVPVIPAPHVGGDQLLYCNSLTAARATNEYFWSDAINLAPRAHSYLANLAHERVFDRTF